jgi:hypothetical protein
MKRSVRRYQQRVAKARRVRILLSHGAWSPSRYSEPKIWHQLCRWVMNEPGWGCMSALLSLRVRRLVAWSIRLNSGATPIGCSGRTASGRMITTGSVEGPVQRRVQLNNFARH